MAIAGSTPAQNMKEKDKKSELVTYDAYSRCVIDLQVGSIDAKTTEDAILCGYAQQYEGVFRVVGKPFTEKSPTVSVCPKGDKAMREAVNDALQKGMDDGDWNRHSSTPTVRPMKLICLKSTVADSVSRWR